MRHCSYIALALLLAGCETAKPVRYIPTPEPFCVAVKTFCQDRGDVLTEGSAQKLEANNLGRAKVCKPRPEDVCKATKPTS